MPKHGLIVWGSSLRSGSLPVSLQALLLRSARHSGKHSNADKNGHGSLVPEEMAGGLYKHSVLRHFISELIRRYKTLEVKGQREEHRQRNIYLYLVVCYTIE